jgi:plastocyanin
LDCGFWIGAVVTVLLITGCGRDTNESPAAPPRVETKFGSGTIRGTVKFVGKAPDRATIANQPCHAGAESFKEETVVVNDNGTLANVFVYLADAPASDGSKNEPAVLDQKNCRYVPHAVAVQAGQALRVVSNDPTLHNVHYDPQRNPPANFGMTAPGSEKRVTFARPEFIRVKCDVHPWMAAYIGVFDSPFFAVSGEGNGSFEISRVPAGKYKLVAWHEQLGEVEQVVEVSDEKVAEISLSYEAPK